MRPNGASISNRSAAARPGHLPSGERRCTPFGQPANRRQRAGRRRAGRRCGEEGGAAAAGAPAAQGLAGADPVSTLPVFGLTTLCEGAAAMFTAKEPRSEPLEARAPDRPASPAPTL